MKSVSVIVYYSKERSWLYRLISGLNAQTNTFKSHRHNHTQAEGKRSSLPAPDECRNFRNGTEMYSLTGTQTSTEKTTFVESWDTSKAMAESGQRSVRNRRSAVHSASIVLLGVCQVHTSELNKVRICDSMDEIIFSRHGVSEVVFSDNGSQYSSAQFKQFSKLYGFKHDTSSRTFAQSNGIAERTVHTMESATESKEGRHWPLTLS